MHRIEEQMREQEDGLGLTMIGAGNGTLHTLDKKEDKDTISELDLGDANLFN